MEINIDKNKETYIFTTANLAKYVYEKLSSKDYKFAGFVDNNEMKNKSLYNLPIKKLEEIKNKDANIIIASINYMYDLEVQSKKLGFKNVISFGALAQKHTELQEYSTVINSLAEDYRKNKTEYNKLYSILEDNKSKEVLNAIIDYRQNFDISIYNTVYDRTKLEYFEYFTPKSDIFIDGGAFDGSNTLDFIKLNPNYKKVYLFEPDNTSLKKSKQLLKNYKNIEYLPYGISDSSKILSFDAQGSLGSNINDKGNVKIKCKSLDEIVKEDKVLIKLDIEGAEQDAVKGATRLIKNGSPLILCVYHKPEDIWKIYKMVNELNPNYKYYLRHYSTTIFDTVLYAV